MLSSSQTVTCPDCGTTATLTMYADHDDDDTDHFDFELSCRNRHQIAQQLALDLWIAAMQAARHDAAAMRRRQRRARPLR